jgi:hypothetical protein
MRRAIAHPVQHDTPPLASDPTSAQHGLRPNSLVYSGQFVLGPRLVRSLPEWKEYAIGSGLCLSAHPELPVTQCLDGDRSLTLVGYLIDPDNTDATDADILRGLLRPCSGIQELTERTFRLAGRWLLIACDRHGKYLFNDTMGLRQAFYSDPGRTGGDLWVMSQPGLASKCFDARLDPAALEYRQWRLSQGHGEFMWPGAASPIRGVVHLLPNHYLDLGTGRSHRFWPTTPLEPVSFDAAVERLAQLLPQIMQAAANRFEIALGITAGIDSRLVLAASKSVHARFTYTSVKQRRMSADHADLVLPAGMLQRLNLPHEVIIAKPAMSDDFRKLYEEHVLFAQEHYGPDVEAILERYGRTKVAVTGSGSEVCRRELQLGLPFLERSPSPEYLAKRDMGGLNPFTVEYLREWCMTAPPDHGVELLDLFEWEQGCGNWLAKTQLTFSLAWRDLFTPFNCREVLTTMLAVPARHRVAPEYRIYRALIERLWPEVLDEPINPHKAQVPTTGLWRATKFLAKYSVARLRYWVSRRFAT